MSNDDSEVERHAGADMVPVGESFEWNPERDGGYPILRPDFNLKVSNQVATPSGVD
ncbi:MAG: hypothetical protein ABSF15_04395 [Candidatus Sulfotelmatobacter sp.]|jgi:hypothetical protein